MRLIIAILLALVVCAPAQAVDSAEKTVVLLIDDSDSRNSISAGSVNVVRPVLARLKQKVIAAKLDLDLAIRPTRRQAVVKVAEARSYIKKASTIVIILVIDGSTRNLSYSARTRGVLKGLLVTADDVTPFVFEFGDVISLPDPPPLDRARIAAKAFNEDDGPTDQLAQLIEQNIR